MFRIDIRAVGHRRVDIHLAGRLAGEHAAQLQAEVSPHTDAPKTVHLDLSGLTGLDHDGLRLLAQLTARGVHLANCPAFLTLWLRAELRSRIRDIS